jgi:hypothetical protein
MGESIRADALIQVFEGKTHFLTYKGERNPSFSTNCNVLASLLAMELPSEYNSSIGKCVEFLCSQTLDGSVQDKWVSSISSCLDARFRS